MFDTPRTISFRGQKAREKDTGTATPSPFLMPMGLIQSPQTPRGFQHAELFPPDPAAFSAHPSPKPAAPEQRSSRPPAQGHPQNPPANPRWRGDNPKTSPYLLQHAGSAGSCWAAAAAAAGREGLKSDVKGEPGLCGSGAGNARTVRGS